MVAFWVATVFVILFPGAQEFCEDCLSRMKVLNDCDIFEDQVLIFTICFPFLTEQSISRYIFLEDCEELTVSNKKFLIRAKNYAFPVDIQPLPIKIFLDLKSMSHIGFHVVISRVPNTTALDIFQIVLLTSYHLSSHFLNDFHNFSSTSLRVDIIFDADYETVLGKDVLQFRNFLLWHLKQIFRRNHSDIHSLTIKKGSIGITFFIDLINSFNSKIEDSQKKHLEKKGPRGSAFYFDEKELIIFLRYLNYPFNIKRFLLWRRISYYLRISDFDNLKILVENVHALELNFEKKNFLRNKDLSLLSPKYHKEQYSNKKHAIYKGKITGKELKHNRIRRYVAREEDSVMKLKIQFKLLKPAKTSNRDELNRHLKSQLAKEMRVPLPSITDVQISSETDVSFSLSAFNDENNVMDDLSVIEAADFLKAKIQSQKLRLRDLNGQPLMTAGSIYASVNDSANYSLILLIILGITLLILILLVISIFYTARRMSRTRKSTLNAQSETFRDFSFGRDSSQSIGKYSYDSGLWLGPGPEPNLSVPDAPYYRPPTVDQVSSTPRPVTAVRTRLKNNWNVDERALSTIPDDLGRTYVQQ